MAEAVRAKRRVVGNEIREEMQSQIMLVTLRTLAFILSGMRNHWSVWNRKATTCVFNSGCCAEHSGKERGQG